MTRVTFIFDEGLYRGFVVDGHACFNTTGPDILCSAISMASQMTVNGLEEVAKAEIISGAQSGNLTVSLISPSDSITEALFRSFDLAMEILQNQYSEFITIKRVGWSEQS